MRQTRAEVVQSQWIVHDCMRTWQVEAKAQWQLRMRRLKSQFYMLDHEHMARLEVKRAPLIQLQQRFENENGILNQRKMSVGKIYFIIFYCIVSLTWMNNKSVQLWGDLWSIKLFSHVVWSSTTRIRAKSYFLPIFISRYSRHTHLRKAPNENAKLSRRGIKRALNCGVVILCELFGVFY